MPTEQKNKGLCVSVPDFHALVQKRISSIDNGKGFTIVSLDIDNFNYINDLFSYDTGDKTLKKLSEHFSKQLEPGEFFTNVHDDNFLFILNTTDIGEINKRFAVLTTFGQQFDDILPKEYSLVVSGGAIVASDSNASINSLIDKANLVRKRAKGSDCSVLRIYDSKVDDEIKWQKLITYMMESALNNHEIQMFLQPKALIKNGQIVGAEALARWVSPKYGMIYPDKFIPIMERTGYIRRLDFFILEEACCYLERCKQQGKPVLPISINFSKAHLNTENLVERIFKIVNLHGISTHLIEIEFTESLSSESLGRLVEIISDLKMLGFKVSLDDFGNAYSSLTCLKDLPIDIIKIDKGFLDTATNNDKGKIILSKMVELIKSLRMLSVAEGIEEQVQLEFLQKLSCDIGQGYYYAKPMPQSDYDAFIENKSILGDIENYITEQDKKKDKSYLYVIPQEFQMDNWELYTLGKNIDMGLMKGYLDGEATVQYVNDRALEYLGYTRQEFREVFNNSIVAFTHPEDAAIVQKNAEELISNGKPLKFQTRAIRKDGSVIILQGRSSCVIDSAGRPVGIYAFQDVTEELTKTEVLQSSLQKKIEELEELSKSLKENELRHQGFLSQSEEMMFVWDFSADEVYFSNKYEDLFEGIPRTEPVITNNLMRQRIHPDDLHEYEEWIANMFDKDRYKEVICRIQMQNGENIRMHCRILSLRENGGKPAKALGVFSRISEQY